MLKSVAGKHLLFLMAAEPEFGAELKSRFTPVWTGVGPVEATLVAAFSITEHRPDLVISLGSAGSAVLEQAEVYQVSSVSYRDMDASAFGFEKGVTPFLDQPKEILLPLTIDGIPSARLSTGGNVVSGNAYDSIDADMVDMETYALMRVCQTLNVPLVGLRGISAGKSDVSKYEDWTHYLEIIDQKLANAVDLLEAQLQGGTIPL